MTETHLSAAFEWHGTTKHLRLAPLKWHNGMLQYLMDHFHV